MEAERRHEEEKRMIDQDTQDRRAYEMDSLCSIWIQGIEPAAAGQKRIKVIFVTYRNSEC